MFFYLLHRVYLPRIVSLNLHRVLSGNFSHKYGCIVRSSTKCCPEDVLLRWRWSCGTRVEGTWRVSLRHLLRFWWMKSLTYLMAWSTWSNLQCPCSLHCCRGSSVVQAMQIQCIRRCLCSIRWYTHHRTVSAREIASCSFRSMKVVRFPQHLECSSVWRIQAWIVCCIQSWR